MPNEIYVDQPVAKVNIGRLTNGIFSFTLLLLFKNIKLPSFGDFVNSVPAEKFGLMQFPDIISFVNAFVVLVMFWIIWFHIFNKIIKFERRILYYHICLLMMIIFIPITSHIYQAYTDNLFIVLLFHLNMLFTGILILTEWKLALAIPGVLESNLSEIQVRCINRRLLVIPVTATFGLILCLFDLPYTRGLYYISMIVLILYYWYTRRGDERDFSGGRR